jgi:hypothetical protein
MSELRRRRGLYRIGKWPIERHLRTIRPQGREVKKLYESETVVELGEEGVEGGGTGLFSQADGAV